MKKISILVLSATILLSGSSCRKYLDVNTNPNQATSSTPVLVLPTTVTYTASIASSYNDYGMEVGGYGTNGGGYGGFGVEWTYNYTTNDHTNLWSSAFSCLENIEFVLDSTASYPFYANFNAVAKILKAYNTQLLVDQYNDVPYSHAFQGLNNLAPAYDKAQVVYQSLADLCDSAILLINSAQDAKALTSATDPLFNGNMTLWKQFANTIKLRLIIRASKAMSFTNTSFSSDGFLITDAIVNPGYAKSSGHVNPSWNTWVADYNNSTANRAWMTSKYALGFYDGNKLNDDRGYACFGNFPNTPVDQLGTTIGVPNPQSPGGDWFTQGDLSTPSVGIFKGPNQGEPIMLAAESYFLQAEAAVRGIISADPATLFNAGIGASFHYLYLGPDDATLGSGWDPSADSAQYMSDNSSSYLVNFSLASTDEQKIEAIITQKWIAVNMINSIEGWNEYRRTGYPKSSGISTGNPYGSFASLQSISPRADKLPTRILYPNSEFLNNDANVPKGISPFSSLIFWAK